MGGEYNLVHNKDDVLSKFPQDEFFSKWISDNYLSWGQKAIRVHLISYQKKKSKWIKCMNIKRQRIKEQWVRFL